MGSQRVGDRNPTGKSMKLPLAVADQLVEEILREEIALAKPDDLAFLESQVSCIARRIVDRLCSRDAH